MSARTRAKASPRRKAGRKASKAKRSIAFRLVVEAQEMDVEYTPNWTGGGCALGHFVFRSPKQPPRRIAVSETGYLSHFAGMEEVIAFGGPEKYAEAFVRHVLDKTRELRATPLSRKQLSLF